MVADNICVMGHANGALEISPAICSECRCHLANFPSDSSESTSSLSSRRSSPHNSQYEYSKQNATIRRNFHFKNLMAGLYILLAGFFSSFVVLTVNDQLPDMKTHPPLPDVFLDNLPYFPEAFVWTEIIMTFFLVFFAFLLIIHKHRCVIWRRYVVLMCSVFLFRCATIYMTSLSVPDSHIKCYPQPSRDYNKKIIQAWIVWAGGGLKIRGLYSCGDYLISGHTIGLTFLNFFIAEHTPRKWYILHMFLWILHILAMICIIISHEHYSIDVFVAFYLCSVLFRYYHYLANKNQPRFSMHSKIIFPFISYFEEGWEGGISHEYENPFSYEILRSHYSSCQRKWKEFRISLWPYNRKMADCLPFHHKVTN